MALLNRLLTTGIALALAGCSAAPTRPTEGAAEAQGAEKPVEEAALPEVALTPELLYQILVAEFAGQEGALRLSAASYLQVAKQTGDPRLAKRATRIAIYARQNETALAAAQLWTELAPADPEARQSLAALLISLGAGREAMPHLQLLLQQGKEDAGHGYLLVANLLSRDPNPTRALEMMAELTADAGNDADALYAHAYLANELNDQPRAQQLLQQLLQSNPKHLNGLILQARVAHILGDSETALKSLQRALRLDPQNHQLRLTYARMLIDARRLAEARREFNRLNRDAPDDADVIYALGLLAMEASDLDDAEKHFHHLLELQQREDEARLALGQIAELRRQPEKAIEWYSSVGEGEQYLEAQLQAIRLIAKQQGIDAARSYLDTLTFTTPAEQVQRILIEAELLTEAERYEEALAVFDEGLAQFPEEESLLYGRALAAERVNRIDILERDLQAILKRDPDNAQALNALGYTLADRTERYEEAYRYIARAYRQRPDDAAILDSMGWVLYRLGRLEESIDYLRRAAAKLQDAEIAAHLGEVLWVSGQKDEARRVWNEALKFAPDDKLLRQAIERFNP